MKKPLKIVLIVLIAIILIALIYLAYVLIDYHRLPDNQVLDIVTIESKNSEKVEINKEYEISSWNIGFAAYLQDYGFFMDGGTESRAYSINSVNENMQDISNKLKDFDSDFYFIQEVDFDSTRSYHIDERIPLITTLNDFSYTFAQNYDSPYLFYPFIKPHGASRSGILTFSSYNIENSVRISLPIQEDLAKLVDLDRCYSINRVPVENGKELILINFHLSAYTTDPTIVTKQIRKLNADLKVEQDKGNYIIAGGDFNKDLLENSSRYFKVSGEDYTWARSYPMYLIPDGINLVAPFDPTNPIPSCRNADGPYDKDTQFQLTIDGFMVSDNIEVVSSEVIDNQFINSDHNPVQMRFILR